MAQSTKTYNEEEIARVTLNFNELEAWRKADADDIPICSVLSVYEASGLEKYIREYCESHDNAQIVALDNLLCNFYTLQRIKNLITDNWQTYGLTINADNKVEWDTSHWHKNRKHYAKKVIAKVRNSINFDFANFCPGVDDELEDNVIVFKVYTPVEEPEVDDNRDSVDMQ